MKDRRPCQGHVSRPAWFGKAFSLKARKQADKDSGEDTDWYDQDVKGDIGAQNETADKRETVLKRSYKQ